MTSTPTESVVIIGSAGHIARRCMAALRGRYRLVGLDASGTRRAETADAQVGVDLACSQGAAQAASALRALALPPIASVLVLAADFDLSRRPSPLLGALNPRAMTRLMAALAPCRPQQWVFLSSMYVHAPTHPGCAINESSPLQVHDDASDLLLALERTVVHECGTTTAVVIRTAPLYDDRGHSTLLAAKRASLERPGSAHLFDYRDTRAGQPLLHVADLADALDRVIARRSALPASTTLLLAEDEPLCFKGLALAEGAGHDPRLLGHARGDVRHFEVNTTQARVLLGWTPRHRVADMLVPSAAPAQTEATTTTAPAPSDLRARQESVAPS